MGLAHPRTGDLVPNHAIDRLALGSTIRAKYKKGSSESLLGAIRLHNLLWAEGPDERSMQHSDRSIREGIWTICIFKTRIKALATNRMN